ncbi:MAG: glycosyltransferase family 4 protein [Candidatus Omnitrophica bacterium]|nr:glycosyltransferase family 4 protein [Candidatus Omnitrophota bacterium]
MRILLLSWRDPKNPLAGGAEVLTEALAARWLARGHQVTWYASRFPGAPAEEAVGGIRYLRAGGRWSVYWHAFARYRRQWQGHYDVIVDEINTIPFFSSWYAREPVILHFNQLAHEVWFYECPLPVAIVGYLLEPLALWPYRRRHVITISESAKRDLLRLGFSAERVAVMPMGPAPTPPLPPAPRETAPTVLFVGRLKRAKRVDHVLRAMAGLSDLSRAQLWIVGNGDADYRRALERLSGRLGLTGRVTFFGAVPEEEKHRLMQRAHVLAVPSVREGWGLVVSEAGVWGTPSAVYPVPGLIDSTRHNVTGWICATPTPRALANALQRLLTDQPLWEQLSRRARQALSGDELDRAADLALTVMARAMGPRDQ